MRRYFVDISVDVYANNDEEAWEKANAFAESLKLPSGIKDPYVGEPSEDLDYHEEEEGDDV